jgi:hypothetical protein
MHFGQPKTGKLLGQKDEEGRLGDAQSTNHTECLDQYDSEIKVRAIPGAGPKLWAGRWFKRLGDSVAVHEPMVEIDADTVIHEIRTPVTRLFSKILVKDDRTGERGFLLGIISQV